MTLDGVDYLMASTFKWLLGPHGSAVTYMSPRVSRTILARGCWLVFGNECHRPPNRFTEYELKPGAACLVAGMPNFASLYAVTCITAVSAHYRSRIRTATNKPAVPRSAEARLAEFGLSLADAT